MILELLKENYKKTFTEPRLSGRVPSEDWLKKFFSGIDAATNLEEFVTAIQDRPESDPKRNVEKHIISRIIAWEKEPPVYYNTTTKEWQREPIK